MSDYDYPFNERIRTFLRLEDLFVKVLFNISSNHEFNHHNALSAIFQILDVIDRAELKADLLQELDRQRNMMTGLFGNPNIAENLLEEILQDIQKTSIELRSNTNKLGQSLRDNEWLMSIKQRSVIPGGLCEFDIPSYHHWLGLGDERRKEDLNHWLISLLPIYDAIKIILHILRGSGKTTPLLATNGSYQQMLGGAKPAQMLRIELEKGVNYYPEVSANKYAISIRFISLSPSEKPRQIEADVSFNLTLCNL